MATRAVAAREVEVASGIPTPEQIRGNNPQRRLQDAEWTCGTLTDEDEDDDDYDDAAVFSSDLGGVGP